MPFVARSPEMQVEWLAQALRKKVLAAHEITPYVRLLLENEQEENRERLQLDLARLTPDLLRGLLAAADIYDIPKLLPLLPELTLEQVMTALTKEPPPYEKNPRLVRDRLFYAVHSRAPKLFAPAALRLQAENLAPAGFAETHARFLELLEDEKLLSDLYPRARAKGDIDLKDLEALSAL